MAGPFPGRDALLYCQRMTTLQGMPISFLFYLGRYARHGGLVLRLRLQSRLRTIAVCAAPWRNTFAAALHDHVLAFTRPSIARNCGVADVVQRKGSVVWGVIYLMEDRDLSALDAAEGYQPDREAARNAYIRHDSYRVAAENDAKQTMKVAIYIAVKTLNPPRPSEAYMRQIVDGAEVLEAAADLHRRVACIPTLEEDR